MQRALRQSAVSSLRRTLRQTRNLSGGMQPHHMVTTSLLETAVREYPTATVTSRTVEGPIHEYTYGDSYERTVQLANALRELGVQQGDMVGTLAWNGYRHLEAWYGTSGIGAVTHTINPRLFPEQLAYIIGHAEDKVLLTDLTFVPLLEKLHPMLPTIQKYVIMTSRDRMPTTTLPNVFCYEELLAAQPKTIQWPNLDENHASSLCYTSGTTGNPKGVLYSHRSAVVHAMSEMAPNSLNLSCKDSVLMVVPMFHACGWGTPYACPASGANLVLPGPGYDGPALTELIQKCKVNKAAGVPTVWLALLAHLEENNIKVPHLEEVVVGGSALPRSMFDRFHKLGALAVHAWGMTELSPLGTVCRLLPSHQNLTEEQKLKKLEKQGKTPYGIEMKITGPDGANLPRDGVAFGNLKVRGPWVCQTYYKATEPAVDTDGWFDTGDVATIDSEGYMQIVDRSKDVVKSGGEWISSVEIENLATGHPAVLEAACIGVYHPKWDERPLLVVVLNEGKTATREELLEFLAPKMAKWWLPDDVAFVKELPHTATGKIQKLALRQQFKDYKLPSA
eukprot:TRINITY_DN84161_c0_g1_i1.p1 TRINITY_DN84161_c0_g1~~TRINITY_DN84161_c0_g1_i1.p1  ORF type:complete len:563 (+),score=60.04 TRINITY_DN84161_c0_g1_i1:28-1716(+)